MGKKPEIQDIYALSPMQEGILFHAMLDSESTAYFEQIEFDIAGRVDVQLVEESMNAVIARHDVFRTLFVTDKVKQPRQVVLKERPIKVHYEDWRAFGPDKQKEKLEEFKAADMAKGFDLVRDPLMRLAVIRLGEASYRWLWSHHHIVMDGWCVSIVMKHFMEYYQLKQQGLPVPRGKTAPYSSYIAWLGEQDREEALGYWERTLAGYEQTASIPKVGQAERTGAYRQQTVSRSLPEETTAALQRLAVTSQATMSTVVQCIWGILLQKYNRTEDAVFGAVVSGRPSGIPGIEDMVGLFINTVPVRVTADGGSFASLVRRVQEASLEAEAYSFVPLYEIQNKTLLKQHLLDHILVFENYPVQQELEDTAEETGSDFQICGFHAYEQTNYDFDITVAPGEGLTFQFSFNAEIYDPAFIEQLAAHVEHIAVQAAADPDIRISDIELLTEEEKKRLAAAFNATDAEVPQKTVHELFEAQVAREPGRTAVLFGNERISYGALNARVNQLARYLLAQGTAREELVAILMDRSPDMLAAILAVWKAGGAYVPVDPGYPAARQQTIIHESGVRFIIGNSESVSAWEEYAAGSSTDRAPESSSGRSRKLILLDRLAGTIAQEPADNIGLPVKPSQLAYVIYTSGSTGTPKGTMIEHAGMLNHILAETEELDIKEGTVLAQNASHCFDISVWQFVAALTAGGVTAIYPNELVLEPARLMERMIEDKTAILEVVPSYLSVMMDHMEETGIRLPDLKYLMITGETVKPAMVRRWFGLCPDIRMVNAYGPAEAADDISQYVMDKPPESEPVPIGRPIRNMRMYIVDDQLRLCPVGTIGEICVSGIGVGRGYLRDPKRTAEVFLEDPFREEEGVRMYRTGDLGRWLPDGNIEFYGRKDYQVKIRGFRIELGEIEARLAEHGRVKEAVVLDVEDAGGVKQLAAYVTAAGEAAPEPAELKAYLARHLPEYMVPASVQVLAELPLSPNGKIDRKALPRPELGQGGGMAGGPPRTETERKLAAIWQEVLGTAEAGRELSFFEAGGHSLKAMTLVSRVHKELGAELPLREVFARPLLHMQADYIDQAAGQGEAYTRIPQAPKQPHYPLSYAQRRMYLLQQMNPGQTGYNMPAVVEVTGKLDTQRVKRVFRQLTERHEALRTSFHMVNKEPVQRIHESAELEMKLVALPAGLGSSEEQDKVRELVKSFIQPFDLSEAPLMRAGWIQCAEDRYILLADFHHIISDGVSMNILVDEFNRLYNGEALEPLAIQYKDYAVWQQEPKQRERLAEQEKYWLSVLDGELPQLQLPADYPRPAVKSFEGATLSFRLEPELAARINKLAADQQSTLFTLLLSAYHVLLGKCSGQDDIITGVPTAGRPQAELAQVFGMFVNTLALRSRPAAGQSFRSFAGKMKDHMLAAFEHQDYPFEELASRLRVERDMSRNPVFETMFVMQNAEEAESRDYGLTFQPYPLEYRMAKFDLTLSAVEYEQDGTIGFNLEYSTRLFRQETAERLAGYYTRVLEQVADNPDMLLQDITVLSEAEEHNLLYGWNRTAAEYPRSKTIHQIFEEQAALWADRTALVHEGRRLTYRELNSRANALAHRLRAGGAGRGTIAAVMADRSVSMVAALLAVLKAGGAYLPVDPAYPRERVRYMLEDSGAAWLLTDGTGQVPESFTGQLLRLDELEPVWAAGLEAAPAEAADPEPINEPSDLAYIIYTSGTTGKPKGAML
ncbi:non-ribosomal peptide synthetase, partial [Paenibacillus tarimensis]|uniref:non-ribosomal peptide synthetase n=1 Tax=Paenibacillus tarimensis TaxID=416012 RepID=UPI001F19A681